MSKSSSFGREIIDSERKMSRLNPVDLNTRLSKIMAAKGLY